MACVEIMLWWLPPVVVTGVAMAWVGWLGRARPTGPDRSEAAQERFAQAILRDLPAGVAREAGTPRVARSTGIAVRPSQRPAARTTRPTRPGATDEQDRRSA